MVKAVLCMTAACFTLFGAVGSNAADAEAGKKVFYKCAVCHSAESGVTRVGPSLYGVVGRKAGSLPNFNYSSAMRKYGVTWTPETLNTYLAAPMKQVKGTKMTFAGIKDETDRANVIAYLETLK
jgi:cytochrome c